MSKLNLKQLITEDKKEEQDLYGLISTILSDIIDDNFNKYLKKGMVSNNLGVKASDSGTRRMTTNTLEFWLEPKDKNRRSIPVDISIKLKMRD